MAIGKVMAVSGRPPRESKRGNNKRSTRPSAQITYLSHRRKGMLSCTEDASVYKDKFRYLTLNEKKDPMPLRPGWIALARPERMCSEVGLKLGSVQRALFLRPVTARGRARQLKGLL
ncbi:MAG: hypothetical protein Q9163_001223 [Psora crenata]